MNKHLLSIDDLAVDDVRTLFDTAVAGALTLGFLTALLIIVLALVLPGWASALLVTLLWAAVASVLAFFGRSRAEEMGKPIPEKTIETFKEDVQWLKNRS